MELISSSSVMIEIRMGIISMVVAVFDIHIDKNAVANINPNKILAGPVPSNNKILRAMRLCKFHFCMANAIRNPPINKNIT